jgi:hypothetical protein
MRVRAVISTQVTDLQRIAIAARYDGTDVGSYDYNGNLIPVYGMRKATQAECREFVETYGWSGLEGMLNDVISELGLGDAR